MFQKYKSKADIKKNRFVSSFSLLSQPGNTFMMQQNTVVQRVG